MASQFGAPRRLRLSLQARIKHKRGRAMRGTGLAYSRTASQGAITLQAQRPGPQDTRPPACEPDRQGCPTRRPSREAFVRFAATNPGPSPYTPAGNVMRYSAPALAEVTPGKTDSRQNQAGLCPEPSTPTRPCPLRALRPSSGPTRSSVSTPLPSAIPWTQRRRGHNDAG